MPLLYGPPRMTLICFSWQSGSSHLQRRVVQQRVPARHEEAVEVPFPCEARQHLPLVHPRADRADDALRPQIGQRGVRLADRLLPVVVGIVDQHDVEAV